MLLTVSFMKICENAAFGSIFYNFLEWLSFTLQFAALGH